MGKGEDGEEMDVFGTGGDEWGRPRDKVRFWNWIVFGLGTDGIVVRC